MKHERIAEIEAREVDTSDIPEVGEEWFAKAKLVEPGEPKFPGGAKHACPFCEMEAKAKAVEKAKDDPLEAKSAPAWPALDSIQGGPHTGGVIPDSIQWFERDSGPEVMMPLPAGIIPMQPPRYRAPHDPNVTTIREVQEVTVRAHDLRDFVDVDLRLSDMIHEICDCTAGRAHFIMGPSLSLRGRKEHP